MKLEVDGHGHGLVKELSNDEMMKLEQIEQVESRTLQSNSKINCLCVHCAIAQV